MMFKNILGIGVMITLFFSCSSDKNSNDDETISPINAIVGVWDATALNIDVNTASQDAILIQQFLAILTDDGCTILTLRFNEDLTASATNSATYVEIDPSTLDVNCPTQSDIETTTYTFDGSIATIVDAEGEIIEVAVRIEGDMMYVAAADLEIPDFSDSGELVFQKR